MATQERAFAALSSSQASERDRAWRALYDEHFPMVYRLTCRFGVPSAEVEDVCQRVFLVVHRKLSGGREIDNVGGFIRGIVVRVVSEHRRWRRVRRAKHWFVKMVADTETTRPTTPEHGAAAAQAQRAIGEVLSEMSLKLRNVLVLTDLEECTPAEAAAILGVPLNTVRSRRRLAREQFRRLWEGRQAGEAHHG